MFLRNFIKERKEISYINVEYGFIVIGFWQTGSNIICTRELSLVISLPDILCCGLYHGIRYKLLVRTAEDTIKTLVSWGT